MVESDPTPPPAPPAPEAQQPPQHTTVIATDYAPRIIVQNAEDDGRWFRCLNWFYDEIVPGLPGAPIKVMLGMLRHRDNRTGMVNRSRRQFQEELRLSKQAVSEALIHLKAHPCSLLAEHGPALFEPLPGRSFASRALTTGGMPEPLKSPPGRTGVRCGGRLSGVADGWSGRVDAVSEVRVRAETPIKTQDVDPQTAEFQVCEDDDEMVRLLAGGNGQRHRGFDQKQARLLIARTGATPETVKTAVANANHLARGNRLRTWQGYIAQQLRAGCTLFEPLQRELEEARRNVERIDRLCRQMAEDEPAAAEGVHAWLRSMTSVKQQAEALSPRERGMDDRQMWRRLCGRAGVPPLALSRDGD